MAITITTPTILAIDLRKFNSVFCWYELANKATEFYTVATTPETIREPAPLNACGDRQQNLAGLAT